MDKLIQILTESGLPFAYDHFAEGESPEPPFICYLLPASDNFAADGAVYFIHSEAIDSDKISIQKTIQKEKVLTGHELVLSGQILGNNSRKLVEQGNRALQLVLYWRMGAAQAIVN